MTKYYGIGLGRTGTTSLCKAFELMGFHSKHYMRGFYLIEFNRYDFISNLPVSSRFEEIDKLFPNSKFIHAVRHDIEAWLQSVKIHLSSKRELRPYQASDRIALYGTTRFNEEILRRSYDNYLKRVSEYFKGREKDLLEMDICAGDGWEKLVPFIGRENIPNENFDYSGIPFPHSNKRRRNKYRVRGIKNC